MTKRVKQPRPTEKVCERSIGPIKEPNENDVICGRGSKSTNNPGNIQYRGIVSQTKLEYLTEPEKLKKKFVAAEIVQRIRSMNPPGRFLKEDFKGGPFYDIGDKAAFKKVGQALREDAPEIRQQMEEKKKKTVSAKTATSSDSATAASTAVSDKKPIATTEVPDMTLNPATSVADDKLNITMADADSKPTATPTVPDKKPIATLVVPNGSPNHTLAVPNGNPNYTLAVPNGNPNHTLAVPNGNPNYTLAVPNGNPNYTLAVPNGNPNVTMAVPDMKPNIPMAVPDRKPNVTMAVPNRKPIPTAKDGKKQQGNTVMKKMFSASKKALGIGSTKRVASDTSPHRATLPPPNSLKTLPPAHSVKTAAPNNHFQSSNVMPEKLYQKPQQPASNAESTSVTSMNSGVSWQYRVDIPTNGKPVGWHHFDKKTSDGLEKEYSKGRTFCQLSSGCITYQTNFETMQQRNLTNGKTRTIRRLKKNSSQSAHKVSKVQRYSPKDAMPSSKTISHSQVASNLMSQNKQVAFDISFHPVDGDRAFSETSSITAASFLSGPSTDSRRRGAAVMQDYPNEQLPIQQHPVLHHNSMGVQQQLHLPPTQQQVTPDNLTCIQEDIISAQDAMTFGSGNSKTWGKFEPVVNNSICAMEEDAGHMKDEMTLDSFNSEILAQDEGTLGGSINSRIWGDEDSTASLQQQTELTMMQKGAPNDLISIPEDLVAAQDECMTVDSFNTRMWDASQVRAETPCPSGSNFHDGDVSLSSAMDMSMLSSRMGTISIASSQGTISTTATGSVPVK